MGYTTFTNGNTPLNDTNLNAMQKGLMQLVFPIGSTYITQTNENPNGILGFGTWERLKGKVCIGLDENDTDFNTIWKTGGSKTHSHKEKFNFVSDHITGNGVAYTSGGTVPNANINTESASSLQPYIVVGYMWIRRS